MVRVAARIEDPVVRLTFLREVASRRPAPRPRFVTPLLILSGLLLLVMVPALSISRAHSRQSAITTGAPVVTLHVEQPTPAAPPVPPPPTDVWLVEKTADSETYSNGLRIDTHFASSGRARSWRAFPADGGEATRETEPAGIVFHTTESQQVPFEESENRALRRIGESLLEYVHRIQAYNFVIDRFGRVYRVVPEDRAANHAGHSVWADESRFYVNLNQSFLGVAFEADGPEIDSGQIRSAGMLIEMLRSRYGIAVSNCVAHAQVSVNPSNMRAGSHVDWASGFPFEAVGLPDNYKQPLPAVWAFGFDADAHFKGQAGELLRSGIEAAESLLAEQAAAEGMGPADYRKKLQQRYRSMAGRGEGP